jgi:hypothetical protein
MHEFKERLETHVCDLFPGYAVKNMKNVGRNPDTDRFRTETYEVTISRRNVSRTLFVKRFSDLFVKNRKEAIEFTIKMSSKRQTNLPKIYGFFSDINSYIMEGVDGKPMSEAFAGSYSNFILQKAGMNKKTEFLVREVARSVAFLQNRDHRRKPFSYRSFVLEKNPELNVFVSNDKKLSGIVEDMEGRKTIMSRGYHDLKLGNVMVCGRQIRFIDLGTFVYKWFFINPVAFSVSLELAQKVPFLGDGFRSLRNAFYDEYLARLNWKEDPRFLGEMEVLKKCELLCYFTRALKVGVPIKYYIPIRLNIKRLRRDIRKFQRN